MTQKYTDAEKRDALAALVTQQRDADVAYAAALEEKALLAEIAAIESRHEAVTAVVTAKAPTALKTSILRDELLDVAWSEIVDRSWTTHKATSAAKYVHKLSQSLGLRALEHLCRRGIKDLIDYLGDGYEEWFEERRVRRERRRGSGTVGGPVATYTPDRFTEAR